MRKQEEGLSRRATVLVQLGAYAVVMMLTALIYS